MYILIVYSCFSVFNLVHVSSYIEIEMIDLEKNLNELRPRCLTGFAD